MDYYGDNDRGAAAWLRELVKEGLIPDGTVEECDIKDLAGSDLLAFRRVHLFAGIGGWAYAFELAGWPRERPVWSGSCPCQPFSAAGKRKGQADERHLWPVFLRLIRECRPATVFGEQVASDDGYRWLARVRDDLEAAGYAVGCADLPACSQGAPHIRSRLFWVANASGSGHEGPGRSSQQTEADSERPRAADTRRGRRARGLADANGRLAGDGGLQRGGEHGQRTEDGGTGDGTADTERDGGRCHESERGPERRTVDWRTATPVVLADGKARRIEPGILPLAHGIPGRVGLIRGAGNAIVPQVGAAFIRAFLEAEAELM